MINASSSFSTRISPKPLLLDGKRRRQRKHQNIILAKHDIFSPAIAFGKNTYTTPLVGVKVVAKKRRRRQSRLFDRRVKFVEGASSRLRATRTTATTRRSAILPGRHSTGGGDWLGSRRYGLRVAGLEAQRLERRAATFVLLLTLRVGSYAESV